MPIAPSSVRGTRRSIGRPGASWRGSTPMIWRYTAMLVRRFDSARLTCERDAAKRDSAWATSVRVTSPTLKRSRVWRSCSSSTSTLLRCSSRMAVSRSTFM